LSDINVKGASDSEKIKSYLKRSIFEMLAFYDYETSYSFSTREKRNFQAVYFDGNAFGITSFGNRSCELSGPKVSGVSPA